MAPDEVAPLTDGRLSTASTIESPLKWTMVVLSILLWMPLHGTPKSTPLERVGNDFKTFATGTFCIENHLLPSIFVIGIKKCGTSTFDQILGQFNGISHGDMKEHHYFDHAEKLNDAKTYYYKKFPSCKSAYRTFDDTPNYTNPDSSSAENIKAFYEKLSTPLEEVSFIAMVCRNVKRLPSDYYFNSRKGNTSFHKHNTEDYHFNDWFEYIMSNPAEEQKAILRRGFYDEVFRKYFDTFPRSSFLLIDSLSAFQDQQALGDAVADFLNIPNQTMRTKKKRVNSVVKEELNKNNALALQSFYEYHEKVFLKDVKHRKNVKTFPEVGFLRKHRGN